MKIVEVIFSATLSTVIFFTLFDGLDIGNPEFSSKYLISALVFFIVIIRDIMGNIDYFFPDWEKKL